MVALSPFTCCANLMERPSSSSESKSFSDTPGRSAQALRVPDGVVPPTAEAEGCHSEATMMGPMWFLRVPPDFEMDGDADHYREIEQARAHAAHFEKAWAESEARVSRFAGANMQARDHILALQEEFKQFRAHSEEKLVRLEAKLRSRFRSKEVAPALERRFQDGISLNQRIVTLEEPNFYIGILDSRNSSALTCADLTEYTAPIGSRPGEGSSGDSDPQSGRGHDWNLRHFY
ncbi:hypothetical protein Nepgr_009631 [Nepenthes gracilis]|uniref:Uncharacterized protein n=1 Tax=Nepenthes gracilis TaxID=150966 RepID=A0AAD3SBK7_NEPGR|nr:hypothetical protein Nepgr_009631 [Nepenthes gracilis]